jgi:hypothetical protein
MPGVEQANPSGTRRQTTQPLVHSAQDGPGVDSWFGAGGPEAAPAMIANVATSKATAMDSVTASDSSRDGMDQP